MQRLMPDSRLNEAEQTLQQPFRKSSFFSYLALSGLVILADVLLASLRNIPDAAPRTLALKMEPVVLDARGFGPLRLAGAWQLAADDPRFGGVSALALDGGRLLALSDAGSVLRFDRPGTDRPRVSIRRLPGGPGPGNRKRGRDSESLAPDTAGGWWVGFEQRHSLFRFDQDFSRVRGRIALTQSWADNRGVEAIAARPGQPVLLFPEAGDMVIELDGADMRTVPLAGGSPISDAAVLPGGDVLLLLRRVTPLGMANALAVLDRGAGGYRAGPSIALPLGAFDNGEALAVEPRAGGSLRLWVMTDNDFRPSRRTLLIAIDVPRGALEGRRRAR